MVSPALLIWGNFKMRKLSLVLGLTMIASCYAYEIINTKTYISTTEAEITQGSLKLQEMIDLRLPAKSTAFAGLVTQHKIDFAGFSYSIFIIGDDALSRKWLREHAEILKKIQAIGFVTNIQTHEAYEALQELAGVPLLPANVDDLLGVLKTDHYPLIAHHGDVWQ